VVDTGLILLHPFLPALFENAGLKPVGEPGLAPQSLARAGGLLYFLATGREQAYEYELGFIKVLIGIRPESPLFVAQGLLTSVDREEAKALLEAALGHWNVLRNTSLTGLRTSFLQRRGLLREEDVGWRLQVQPESFDVLLDHLPWGIGTVRLPWVPRPIFTEWSTP
jgi:hypothetical protein